MILPANLMPQFHEVWAADFEFQPREGALPNVVCLVARELRTGRTERIWQDQLRQCGPPYRVCRYDSLYIAYYSTAEFACHLALGWELPRNVLDLWVEFRNCTNGRQVSGLKLLDALNAFGIVGIDASEKEAMRRLILDQNSWDAEERAKILRYCESDVSALEELLPRMAPHIDVPRALLRGKYMTSVAMMEKVGIPIDTNAYEHLVTNWDGIKQHLIEEVDELGVYDGQSFRMKRWAQVMEERGIGWPRLPSGAPALDDETFRQMARAYGGVVALYHELRHTLGRLRMNSLEIGPDGRNRTNLRPFASRTGRNQPSTSKSLYGPATWIRSLIKPPEGHAVAYLDYGKQELAIAAVLSGDARLQADYRAGDPYLGFGKAVGMVPADATKKTHPVEREVFKAVCLGVQYGLTEFGLARRLAVLPKRAGQLLQLHRERYQALWAWSDAAVAKARLAGCLQTPLGWRRWYQENERDASIRNYLVQATGADILRLAVILAIEDGISVCAPVHDALLIEARVVDVDEAVERTQFHMRRAAEMVLGGFALEIDASVVRFPDRYTDNRGREMWARVWGMLERNRKVA